MPENHNASETARFLRTLRVATATSIARHALLEGVRDRPAGTKFLALAAKGRDDWRFPAEGLLSDDGLVLASLVDDAAGYTRACAAGARRSRPDALRRFSDRTDVALWAKIPGVFNRDGAFRLALSDKAINEVDLAGFEIEPEAAGP